MILGKILCSIGKVFLQYLENNNLTDMVTSAASASTSSCPPTDALCEMTDGCISLRDLLSKMDLSEGTVDLVENYINDNGTTAKYGIAGAATLFFGYYSWNKIKNWWKNKDLHEVAKQTLNKAIDTLEIKDSHKLILKTVLNEILDKKLAEAMQSLQEAIPTAMNTMSAADLKKETIKRYLGKVNEILRHLKENLPSLIEFLQTIEGKAELTRDTLKDLRTQAEKLEQFKPEQLLKDESARSAIKEQVNDILYGLCVNVAGEEICSRIFTPSQGM